MARRLPISPRIVLLAVFALIATSCTATATLTPTAAGVRTAADTTEAALIAPDVFDEYSDRIDFLLTRDDVDCSGAGLTLLPNTQVWSAHYVVDGKLGARCGGRTNAVLVDAWKMLASLTPPEHLKELGVFVGYTNMVEIDESASYVGFASSLGWRASAARVSIDIDYAFEDTDRLAQVLVHEMGHVMAATRTETLPAQTEAECDGWLHQGHCYRSDARLLEFAALYWGPAMLDELEGVGPGLRPSNATGKARCDRNPGFWSSYSASNPHEDFASSYAAFVFDYLPQTPEQQERHNWFARNPELAITRDYRVQAGFAAAPTPSPRCDT